jgi:hypothetical protein
MIIKNKALKICTSISYQEEKSLDHLTKYTLPLDLTQIYMIASV